MSKNALDDCGQWQRRAAALDFVFATDARVYMRGRPKRGRRWFTGVALTQRELARLGYRPILAWAIRGNLAFGSDGRVYVWWSAIASTHEGRDLFEGYELTHEDERHPTIRTMALEVELNTKRLVERWTREKARRPPKRRGVGAGRRSSPRKS